MLELQSVAVIFHSNAADQIVPMHRFSCDFVFFSIFNSIQFQFTLLLSEEKIQYNVIFYDFGGSEMIKENLFYNDK